MVLDVPGGLFGQKDVREGVESVNNKSNANAAQWTTAFSTASTSYVDVTNATVTVSGLLATKTYTAIAVSCVDAEHSSAGIEPTLVLDIEGTEVSECRVDASNSNQPFSMAVNGLRSGLTGVTSITAKLKAKTPSSTFYVNRDTLKKEIHLIVLEE